MSTKLEGWSLGKRLLIETDLLASVVHETVETTIHLSLLGVDWNVMTKAVEALAYNKIIEVIEIEETQNKMIISAEWIQFFGKNLRLLCSPEVGLQRRFIDVYIGKGVIPSWHGEKVDAKVVEVLSPTWKMFEIARNGPATILVLVGGFSVKAPVKRPRNQTLSESLAFDYVRWRLTGKLSKQLKAYPLFGKS